MTAAQHASGDNSLPPLDTLRPETANTISGGTSYGPTIQARLISGGIHIHTPAAMAHVPRQLLPVSAAFTDRTNDIDSLITHIRNLPEYSVRIVVLSGEGGIGKTALANRLLQMLSSEYAGGQLYADLRGYSPDGPADTPVVLARFLRCLRPQAQPADREELAAWWRSATGAQSDRPVSILLDNARDSSQVRELLPGGAGHLVVATSRNGLAGLASDGAVAHQVGPFDKTTAYQYLTRCLGEQHLARNPAGVARAISLAAGSPMAIALAVNRLAAADLAQPFPELTSPTIRCAHREAAVDHALDQAYRSLSSDTPASAVYGRMAATFAADFDAPLTAAICNLTRLDAADTLDQLHRLHLIELLTDDPARGKVYRYHDLARSHGRARAAAETTAAEARKALRRGLDFYLSTASTAERILTPTHRRLRRDYIYVPAEPLTFGKESAAMSWLYAQRDNLLAAMRAAHTFQLHRTTSQLAHAIWPLLRDSHDFELWSESHDLGLKAARLCQDREAEIELLNTWGVGLRSAHRFEDAAEKFSAVLMLARETGDPRAEAQSLHELGSAALHSGRLAEAEDFLLQARRLRTELLRASQGKEDQRTYRRAVAITNICLGQVYLTTGHPTKAVEDLTDARNALVEIPDGLDAGRALAWLARAHAAGGDLATAEEYGRRAVTEFNAVGSARWRAYSLELLGHTVRSGNQPDRARSLYEEALAIYESISPRDEERVRQHLQEFA
ncbi:tetratricopeptide repeat protein [Streptomyces sp. NPDC101455]|uniref:tetratricopeptide repeat protein n=1 Tax=Streptomyces sp. NPDC101455 TaxID=3366142 RepID=UPI00381F9D43